MNFRALLLIGGLLVATTAWSADVVFNSALMTRVPGGARSVVRVDPVENVIDTNGFQALVDQPTLATEAWTRIEADAKGSFSDRALNGGYALCTYDSQDDRIAILEEKGATMVYVNGDPRAGDPYSFGYLPLPVHLHKGVNNFLFSVGRGHLEAKLVDAPGPISVDTRDSTLPDEPYTKPDKRGGFRDPEVVGAVEVRNATDSPQIVVLESRLQQGKSAVGVSAPFTVPALTVKKVPVIFKAGAGVYDIVPRGAKKECGGSVTIERAKEGQAYKVTFESQIDHSIQYYAALPSSKIGPNQALVLSLHGASVEAIGQARAYSQRDWCNLVAATNRRPYGFDWEEVGRADALEVLGHAEKAYKPDLNRVYLTGHSMGGHGTWSVGSLFPDKFAAIMPSAGWISFNTYGGGGKFDESDPVQAMIKRSSSVYDTLARKQNLFQPAIYVLHGEADDNVPITEAKTMVTELAGHSHIDEHWEPGAGHWWSKDGYTAAACVDWRPGFELFQNTTLAISPLHVNFATPSPAISAKSFWVTVGEQIRPLELSTISAIDDPVSASIIVTTANLVRFQLDRGPHQNVVVDGQKVAVTGRGPFGFVLQDGKWIWEKRGFVPAFVHGLKSVLLKAPLIVIPTGGSTEEKQIALATARFWSESFLYRGNGDLPFMTDAEALKMGRRLDDHNLILLGRADTNLVWTRLKSLCPLAIDQGKVTAGSHVATGDNVASLVLGNVAGGRTVLFAGSTGVPGAKLLARTPLFQSGAAYPDFLVWSTSALRDGADGLVGAGFSRPGEPLTDIAWRE